MVTKDIKVSYGKRFDTGGCAYDQMLSIRLKSAEMLKLEVSIKETRQECRFIRNDNLHYEENSS